MSVTMAEIDTEREKADVAKARMQVLRGHFAPGSDHDLCKLVGACDADCGKVLSDFWKAEEECAAAERNVEQMLWTWRAQGCREVADDDLAAECAGISDDGQCGIHPPGTPGCVNNVRPPC
jgi:hypothetical protein